MSLARNTGSAVVFSFTCIVFSLNSANAQMPDISTDHVKIDLSVINNQDSRNLPLPYYRNSAKSKSQLDLLLPGSSAPTSKLHIYIPKASGTLKLKKIGNKTLKYSKENLTKAKKKLYSNQIKILKPVSPKMATKKPSTLLITKSPPIKIIAPVILKKKTIEKVLTKPSIPLLVKRSPELPVIAPPPAKKTIITEAKSETKKKQVNKEKAALPLSDKALGVSKSIMVRFDAKTSKFPKKAKKSLLGLVNKIKEKNNLRLQLVAFAGGKSISPSKARRLSLSRALSVRSFLIENGVKSTRIDVRALGSKTTTNPLNRVDVNIIER
jgi:outer membrane protein OmpA-like peptidoglycan-associated protein